MSGFAKFRDGLIGPTLILLTICAVITLALAGVYQMTEPVIAKGEIVAANDARAKVLASGDSFTMLDGIELPEGVSEVSRADNGTGFVIRSAANGYGGAVTYMIGIDSDGAVVGIQIFDHNETPGLGTKVGDQGYLDQYMGHTDPFAVDAVTGATRTSNSLKNALNQALAAYELVKEAA